MSQFLQSVVIKIHTLIFFCVLHTIVRTVRNAVKRYGILHTLGRGVEFLLLQTQHTAKLYYKIAPAYYRYKYSEDLKRYSKPPDIFATYWIDPNRVKRFSLREDPSQGSLYKIGSIMSGDWDTRSSIPRDSEMSDLIYANKIKDTSLYQALEARFCQGVSWEETEFIQRAYDRVEEGENVWNDLHSIEQIKERCRDIDRLYMNIRRNGYKSQKELREIPPSINEPFGYLNEQIMEVSLDIARDGELLLADGRHRLILAQFLEVDKIPVTIIVRHRMWMNLREEKINNGEVIDHIDFPALNEN